MFKYLILCLSLIEGTTFAATRTFGVLFRDVNPSVASPKLIVSDSKWTCFSDNSLEFGGFTINVKDTYFEPVYSDKKSTMLWVPVKGPFGDKRITSKCTIWAQSTYFNLNPLKFVFKDNNNQDQSCTINTYVGMLMKDPFPGAFIGEIQPQEIAECAESNGYKYRIEPGAVVPIKANYNENVVGGIEIFK